MLGVDRGNGPTRDSGFTYNSLAEHRIVESGDSADATLLPAIGYNGSSRQPQGREIEWKRQGHQSKVQQDQEYQQQQEQRQEEQQREQQKLENNVTEEIIHGPTAARGAGGPEGRIPGFVDTSEGRKADSGGGLMLWPESTKLPTAAGMEPTSTTGDGIESGWGRRMDSNSHGMDGEVLKAVARLFLSKLQISVEVNVLLRPLWPTEVQRQHNRTVF